MRRLEAAISPCPNDVFIFSGLLSGTVSAPGLAFDFAFEDLESLNQRALQGRGDLIKISYANYPGCAREYGLLRCGGALGRGCGPLLLSNVPLRQTAWEPAGEILVPGRNTTANFLLDYFAGGRPLRKVFLPFDEVYRRLLGREPCQGVVIHEMRFTYAGDGLHLIRDLGGHWEKDTGHPIPLGAMAMRREVDPENTGLAVEAENLIRASLRWARAHREEALALCRQHSQSLSEEVLLQHIDLYVNDFSLDLGEAGDQAVDFFLERHRSFYAGAG